MYNSCQGLALKLICIIAGALIVARGMQAQAVEDAALERYSDDAERAMAA
jgi:hypothetical protein